MLHDEPSFIPGLPDRVMRMPTTLAHSLGLMDVLVINLTAAIDAVACSVPLSVMARFVIGVPGIIPPDAAPVDATVSSSVRTVMPVLLPTVAAPIVTPLRVMVKAVAAAIPTTAVVMTMELAEMADVAVMASTDVLPAVLSPGLVSAKNPAG